MIIPRFLAIAMISIVAAGAAPALHAQTPDPRGPTSVGPGSPAADAQPAGVLSQAERNRVRRAVRKSAVLENGDPTSPGAPAIAERQVVVGKPLPLALPARLAPESLIDALPPRPDHEYWIFADNIALVESVSRNVVDIIRDVF